MKECKLNDCNNKSRSLGMCAKHYAIHYKKNIKPGNNPCSVSGCDNPTDSFGMCHTHYYRTYRNGTLSLRYPKSNSSPGTKEYIMENITMVKAPYDIETPCWIWNRKLNNKGYGLFSINGGKKTSHRSAYELFVGEILDDKPYLCHKCDVRSCCNPDHLFTGTQKDNMQDMKSKSRGRKPNTL